MTAFRPKKVAVLGAGVMGAQIAAHFINAGIPAILYDLPAEDDVLALVKAALGRLQKLQPAPWALAGLESYLEKGNYRDDLEKLRSCDFIIEAVAEKKEIKSDLYGKIAPFINENAILASNTSGIPIHELAKALPESLRARFCGVHFFNPPRYMHLVELIPQAATSPILLDQLETFLTTCMGKGVVRAKDTPNFIGNRIGVFSLLATMIHADRLQIPFEVVDALTGPLMGRPKSATYRTADVVGLDTLKHVVATMEETLRDDPWHHHFKVPAWLQQLIDEGALGQKTGRGIYLKEGKTIKVLDAQTGQYREQQYQPSAEVIAMLKEKDPAKVFANLRASSHKEAQFLWAVFRDLFHYTAFHLETIANSARDVDLAMRWGYGWSFGPFETWQAAGWQAIAKAIDDGCKAGETLADAPLPAWVLQINGVHSPEGSFAAVGKNRLPRSGLAVYKRQLWPEVLLGEQTPSLPVLLETDAIVLSDLGHDIGVVSFKTKMNTMALAVLDGILEAVRYAEKNLAALVVWQKQAPFSAGANLQEILSAIDEKAWSALDETIARFQQATTAMRRSLVPTVAAVNGLALGGGCELMLHCDHVVASLETYTGLVEAGVGVLPAGGGTKEMALRASEKALDATDPFEYLKLYFERIAMAKVSASALEAKSMDYLKPSHTIILHPRELLYVAREKAKALSESAYRPPLPAKAITACGTTGYATLCGRVVNLEEGGFISAYDAVIAKKIAEVICGGPIVPGSKVDEDWFLKLERQAFVELCQNEATRERIAHMLKTGKPLRN